MKEIERIMFKRHHDEELDATHWLQTTSNDNGNAYLRPFKLHTLVEWIEMVMEVSTLDEELEVVIIRRK